MVALLQYCLSRLMCHYITLRIHGNISISLMKSQIQETILVLNDYAGFLRISWTGILIHQQQLSGDWVSRVFPSPFILLLFNLNFGHKFPSLLYRGNIKIYLCISPKSYMEKRKPARKQIQEGDGKITLGFNCKTNASF